MTVLRELVARLGFEVDKSGFTAAQRGIAGVRAALGASTATASAAGAQMGRTGAAAAAMGRDARKAEKGVAGTSNAMAGLARLAAAAGLTHVITSMVKMASDANETSNVLKEVFGAEGLAQVEQWSNAMAGTMGRSKYDLQQYAGALGAVLGPMVNNRAKAQEMSTTLAGLAVDLGSFYNATDEDAMHALRSGLTGEMEALKRFGIVLNDATMGEYARAHGITKKITAMNNAEKTELRYGAIMEATKTAQGDAARTGDGFANAMKGLKSAFKDIGTEMGMTVIPALEKVIRYARDGLAKFKELTQGTFILKGAMITLSAVAAALALNMVAAFVLPALGVLALIVLLDELHTLFTGGKSVIGDWLDELGGVGTAETVVQTITDAFNTLTDTLDNLPDVPGMFDLWAGAVDDLGFRIDRLIDKYGWLVTPQGWAGKAADVLTPSMDKSGVLSQSGILKLLHIDPQEAEAEGRTSEQGLAGKRDYYGRQRGETAGSIDEEVSMYRRDREARVKAESEARTAARAEKKRQREVERAQAAEDATMSRDPNEDAAAGMSVAPNSGPIRGRARVRPRAAAPTQAAPAAPTSAANPVVTPLASYASQPYVSAPAAAAAPAASSTAPNMSVNITSTTNISGTNMTPGELDRTIAARNEKDRRATLAAISSQSGG